MTVATHDHEAPSVAPMRVPLACFGVLVAAWLALALAPHAGSAWVLESAGVFVAVPILVATYRSVPLSDRSYVQGTLLMLLHLVGAHYGYAEVPFGRWLGDLLGLERNPFDRAVHLAYGALLLYPTTEVFLTRARVGRVLGLVFAVAMLNLFSTAHELIEVLMATVVSNRSAEAYLAMQGDPWDAQKDLAFTAGGAALAAVVERALSPLPPERVRR